MVNLRLDNINIIDCDSMDENCSNYVTRLLGEREKKKDSSLKGANDPQARKHVADRSKTDMLERSKAICRFMKRVG